ncbi:MAG TPA: cytochrome D1 domain-containing protein [Acidiferrobacteraceae bacterium]|nr:cytochrome D1 domain-containing protein [Acidiferrobacteraceae bacterium]
MSGRWSAAILALSALTSVARADNLNKYFPGRLYVTVQGSNAVEVFPQQTVLHGLRAAHYDDISPNGRLLLVTSANPGQVYVVNAHTGRQLAKIPLGKATQGVKITPDSRTALVVEPGAGAVAVIDLTKLKLVKTIHVGAVPHNVRFTHDGTTGYVTLQKSGGVAVIDMQTLKRTGMIALPGLQGPHNLDLADHDRRLWVRDLNDHAAVVDLRTGKVLKYIEVGKGHGGLDVIPGGRYVFVGAIADTVVDAIDTHTLKVVRRIVVGAGPHGVRASRDGRWVYAEVTGTNRLAVISTHSLKVVRQIPVKGRFPFWGAVRGNE